MNADVSELDDIVAQAAALHRAGDTEAAGAAYDAVLDRAPAHTEALHLKGIFLGQGGRMDEALGYLDRAVAGAPGDARILANRAKLRLDMRDVAGAVADYTAALEAIPDNPDLLFNAAGALSLAGRSDEAIARLEDACVRAPDHARARANLGNLYRQAGRLSEARACLEQAVVLTPGDAQVQHSLGVTLSLMRDYEGAAARFRRALELDRGFVRAAAQLFYANLHACDWQQHETLVANFARLIGAGGEKLGELSPLIALFLPESQQRLNAVAEARAVPLRAGERAAEIPARAVVRDMLRVGYLSADLGRHPVGHLLAEVLPEHDRSKVQVSAVLLAPPDGSTVARRIGEGVDAVIDVSRMSASDATACIRQAEIDVLVDLGGYTRGARPEILAGRPAPLQIGWLGYCGSSGGLNDVILADSDVLPEGEAEHFAETVAHLSGSFMPLNSFDTPSDDGGTRGDHGLPEDAFVFCAFNTPTKIDPATFAAWMDILKKVEGSVLWLREHAPVTTRNLQRAAQQSGLDPARLVFAGTLPEMSGHLARHRHADLFLDTFVYGAHSTAADAIATGLPILTCAGPAMPSRVGASLARSHGLGELVVGTPADYVALAIGLAGDRSRLTALRAGLAETLGVMPHGARFAGKLELAYHRLWRALLGGELHAGHIINIEATGPLEN